MLRILLITGDAVYARLISGLLSRCPDEFGLTSVKTPAESKAVLARDPFDAILLDLAPPHQETLRDFEDLFDQPDSAPVILLVDDLDAPGMEQALHSGAYDHLLKGDLSLQGLRNSVRYAVEKACAVAAYGGEGSLLEGLLDSLPAAAGVLECQRDSAGKITDFLWRLGNVACATVLGVNARDLIGQLLSQTVPALVSSEMLAELQAMLERRHGNVTRELCWTRHDKMQWVAISAGCLGDGLALVVTDVTLVKQQEQALITAKQHAELADDAKSRVLRTLSHEMRQPLNTIVGFSDMIDNEVFGPLLHPQYKAYIKDIHTASQSLSQILDDLLERSQLAEMAKLDTGYRQMIDLAPDMICALRDGVIVMMNAAGAALLGVSPAESCIGRLLEDFVDPEYRALLSNGLSTLLGEQGRVPLKMICSDGRVLDVEMAASMFSHEDIGGAGVMVVARDVTQRQTATRAILQREERLRKIMETMVDALIIIDHRGIVETFNPAAERIFGYTASDVVGQNISMLMPPVQAREHDGHLLGYLHNRTSRVIGIGREVAGQRKDGSVFPMELALSEMSLGDHHYFIGVLRDITERKQAEERLRFLATRDHLTGLPNRAMFRERLEEAVAMADDRGDMVGILFVDLDHFKNINDTLGHQVGDRVLQAVGRRLEAAVRTGDHVFHLSGDEFTLILRGLKKPEEAAELSDYILAQLALPFEVEGREIYTSASIGIVIYPENAESIANLLKNVDTAVHHAKRQGRNTYTFYSENLSQNMIRRLQIENGLRRVLERNELLVVYQPKMDLAKGVCIGAEALLRWNSEELGFVSPAEFIPVAEETGLIVSIGDWVLLHVCQQIATWMAEGRPPMRIAVNLSARQFREPTLTARIVEILEITGIPATLLELELTESMLVENAEDAIAALRALKALGITLSIDDFGTGYSSLSYLKRFPIDALKIDQSFVRDIPESSDDMSITKAIISMGRSLELKIVAEGTETVDQVDFLRENGCHIAQGYYFSKPVHAGLFEEFLDTSASFSQRAG